MHDPCFVAPGRRARILLLAVTGLLLSAGLISLDAQSSNSLDADGSPYYGTRDLEAGFPDDPHTVPVRAGGTRSAEDLGSGCVGSIGIRPDLRLHYEADEILPLNIYAVADNGDDISLVIRRPDGSWICNADYGDLDAAVLMERPMSGQYDIWVGGVDGEYVDGHLHISERPPRN